MKFILTMTVLLLVAIGCGKESDIKPYSYDLSLCDPADNSAACPQTLRNDATYKRDILVGDEGIGIEVRQPNEAKNLEACRLAKRSILDSYVRAEDLVKFPDRLSVGEFIDEFDYRTVSEGRTCTRKNILGSCTKYKNYVRVVCAYRVYFSPTLSLQK